MVFSLGFEEKTFYHLILRYTCEVGTVILNLIPLLQLSYYLNYKEDYFLVIILLSNYFFQALDEEGKIAHFKRITFACVLGKPHSSGSSERIQLSGMYNVRKGKMQLPVNRWTRRHVILCGTCLIVSSVKDSLTGKMHVLPLIGGKVSKA